MTEPTVLIAALAGRSLAQSARRAGYCPRVVDAFGDLDMQAATDMHAVLPEAARYGFRARTLLPALDKLAARAGTGGDVGKSARAIGLVLGSGFEGTPRLMRVLNARIGLIGTPVDVIANVNDPVWLADTLVDLAIPHPETRRSAPPTGDGWLSKVAGATGGGHVRMANDAVRGRKRYFQRRLNGNLVSVFALAGQSGCAFGLSRQWTTPSPRAPYRYGGAVRVTDAPAGDNMIANAERLIERLALRGLVSFDFCVANGTAYLLEINARPGATLDLFDSAETPLFGLHIAACRGEPVPRISFPSHATASAILYAGDDAFTMPQLDWPAWAADRTSPGQFVPAHAPIATVLSAGETAQDATNLLRQRLADLECLIYERANN